MRLIFGITRSGPGAGIGPSLPMGAGDGGRSGLRDRRGEKVEVGQGRGVFFQFQWEGQAGAGGVTAGRRRTAGGRGGR